MLTFAHRDEKLHNFSYIFSDFSHLTEKEKAEISNLEFPKGPVRHNAISNFSSNKRKEPEKTPPAIKKVVKIAEPSPISHGSPLKRLKSSEAAFTTKELLEPISTVSNLVREPSSKPSSSDSAPNFKEEVECGICLEMIIPPVVMTNCSHNFCLFCIRQFQFSNFKKFKNNLKKDLENEIYYLDSDNYFNNLGEFTEAESESSGGRKRVDRSAHIIWTEKQLSNFLEDFSNYETKMIKILELAEKFKSFEFLPDLASSQISAIDEFEKILPLNCPTCNNQMSMKCTSHVVANIIEKIENGVNFNADDRKEARLDREDELKNFTHFVTSSVDDFSKFQTEYVLAHLEKFENILKKIKAKYDAEKLKFDDQKEKELEKNKKKEARKSVAKPSKDSSKSKTAHSNIKSKPKNSRKSLKSATKIILAETETMTQTQSLTQVDKLESKENQENIDPAPKNLLKRVESLKLESQTKRRSKRSRTPRKI